MRRPTIYFDPQATDPYGRGTFLKPYSTAAQLEAAINQLNKNNTVHVGGQVIGFKRGSILHGGITLSLAGEASDPVSIVPYGDAEALPIITGASVYALTENAATGWATSSDARVYKVNSATEYDVFDVQMAEGSQRFTKVAAGGDEAATIAAVVAAGPGTRSFLSGVIYIYPFNGTPDWTKIEYNDVAHRTNARNGLAIYYANIAASGYITVTGMHARSCANIGMTIASKSTALANITSLADVRAIGCKMGNCGVDRPSAGVDTSMSAGSIYGISSALRISNPMWLGNRIYDVANNAGEFGDTDGLIFERNTSLYSTGPGCAELYRNNSNSIIRYNVAVGRQNKLFLSESYGHKGLWISGYDDTSSTRDASKSVNNVAHHNVITQVGSGMGIDICGDGVYLYNNYVESVQTSGGANLRIYDTVAGATHTSFTAKNNIFNGLGTAVGRNIASAANVTHTLSDNWYRRSNGSANINLYSGATATEYSTLAAIIAGPDAGALGAATTFTEGRAAAGSAVLTAGVSVAGYTEVDLDGVYAATPAIGPYYVGS